MQLYKNRRGEGRSGVSLLPTSQGGSHGFGAHTRARKGRRGEEAAIAARERLRAVVPSLITGHHTC